MGLYSNIMGIYGRQMLITIFVMVCQAACKPGSVRSDYSSRMLVTKHLLQPTQTTRWKYRCYINIASCFYLVLLPAGFTKLFQLPETRCALTTPFHPYFNIKRYIFCCTFPRVSSAGRYPALYFHGARTFLSKL